MNNPDSIPSPCIGVCHLDEEDVCQGCFRTAHEITEWTVFTEEEKLKVIKQSSKRRSESGFFL